MAERDAKKVAEDRATEKWEAVLRMSRCKNWDGELFGNVLTRSELATLYDAAVRAHLRGEQ